MKAIVVAGELGSFFETAERLGVGVRPFVAAYQRLVQRYLHSHPLFVKFLGDQFLYVYESSSPSFARNVLHSTMVLEGAFREATAAKIVGSEDLFIESDTLESLQVGLSEGHVYRIDGPRGLERDFVGVPVLAARVLAEEAGDVKSHILVDTEMSVDAACRRWLQPNGIHAGKLKEHLDEGRVTANIVTPDSMLRE